MFTTLGGCSEKAGSTTKESPDKGQATQTGGSANTITSKPITLSYWAVFSGLAKETIPDLSKNEVYMELEKRTNVKLNFIHPAQGQEAEQFNLMIASGDIPDIIEQAERYKGGIDKAISDGIYIKLNDFVDKHAPNFKKVINSNENLKKQVYSDNGNLLGFGMITSDLPGSSTEQPSVENPYAGPFLRNDWLKELNMKVPTTIDEWYAVLKAFKDVKKAEVPFLWDKSGIQDRTGAFLSAYGIGPAFFIKDGQIKYGPIEPGFKQYLELLNKWYKEGLIDKDFPTRDAKSAEALYMSGKVGATLNDSTALCLKTRAVGIDFVGAPYPKINANTDIHWRYLNNICRDYYGVVTSKNKYPVESVKWFDYHYSAEGFKLFNFGVEGKSYTKINDKGRPEYVDYIAKNNYQDFDRFNMVFRLHNGPYLKSDGRSNPRRWMEDLESYRITWDKQPSDYVMPPVTLTEKEGKEYATIMSDIDSYKAEMVIKFIIGQEPLSKFDEFADKIKKMNIQKSIELQKTALDRYNKRVPK